MMYGSNIATAFQCPGTCRDKEPYGSGHINDTFKVSFVDRGQKKDYIMQRVNRHIFQNVPALISNIGKVTRHQRRKFVESAADDIDRRVLTLILTLDGLEFYQDDQGDYWRMYAFIDGAVGIDVVENTKQAFEAARAFGEFQCQLADLSDSLHETIPDFHHTRSRFNALQRAIEADVCSRAGGVTAEIAFAFAREPLVDVVLDLMATGEIPERVTHNDTKLNNVLIDEITGKAACVIDLDTVMPGSVLYDFGDMVRSATTQAAEDEPDLSKVSMNIHYFEALLNGYLETASGFLVPKEKELLPLSGKLITFEIGLRFLTDYLQGDTYFKTHRPGQNLDRCRKQFRMVESMEEQMELMQKLVEAF